MAKSDFTHVTTWVFDLDNTLWGGVIGDDGMAGMQLGEEHPGRAFKDLQRAVIGLRERGIVLPMMAFAADGFCVGVDVYGIKHTDIEDAWMVWDSV